MGTQVPPEKMAQPPHPIFGPCLLWPNGWMDKHATIGTEVDLGTGQIVLDVVPPVRERGTAAPPLFSHVYCGHGSPSQLLLSSCSKYFAKATSYSYRSIICGINVGLNVASVLNGNNFQRLVPGCRLCMRSKLVVAQSLLTHGWCY